MPDFDIWLPEQPWVQAALGLLLLALLAFAARFALQTLLMRVATPLRQRWDAAAAAVLLAPPVLRRLAQVVPSLVMQVGTRLVPGLSPTLTTIITNVAVALTVFHLVRVLLSLLDVVLERQPVALDEAASRRQSSAKSWVQLGKLLVMLGGAIVMVAALIDRSPLIVLSGLGAMSAVLMLIFKDTILSFTAGVQLASNDMLRLGDWIEMPQVGADGDVVDIGLNTVKVQNWDRTITTIPTWRLMSESYRNWRGMAESGGRRIKRTLLIDAASVRFLTDAEVTELAHISLLTSYLEDKQEQVEESRAALPAEAARVPTNRRRLTNLGTFRAYVQAYLRQRDDIRQDMTLLVRTQEPTAGGVPLEVYCFTATTAWVAYEGIQGDVFDHLLAILPEFGLRAFQTPSGGDVRTALAALQADVSRARAA